jgi:hypothetical protein
MMKKITLFVVLLMVVLFACSCGDYEPNENYTPPEKPHLYWKDIDVEIVDIKKSHSLNGRRYTVVVTVKSEEYGLQDTFVCNGSNWDKPNVWKNQKGDTIKAELYSWVMRSTGKVVKRQIAKVYY